MDDDLPPLISDAELSDIDDGSSLPELEQSDGSGFDADSPQPAPEAPAVMPPQQTGQQQVRGSSSTPAAHQQRHGIHLHPRQQHGHHGCSRHQRRGPVNERQRRMEAGINRNSRLWQVLDADDSLAHSLGASPFEDDHRGPAAQSGMPLVQFMPTASGEMMVTATLPTGSGPRSSQAGPRSNPLANMLSSTIRRSNNNSSSSSQRSGPLFVQGQGAQHGPNSAFQGLAMPFVMGGQINIMGPTAAGAAAGAAGQPRGNNQPSLNALTQQLARSIERSMLVGGDNFAGRTAAAAAPVSRSVPDASATTAAFFRALATSVGSSQASSDTGSPMSGPFRSGPRLRARRSRHQSAAAAAAARAEHAAASPGTRGMFTFSSTPPQAAPVARANAASTAEAPAVPPAATAGAATARPAAVAATAAAAATRRMPDPAEAAAPAASPADEAQVVQQDEQQQQQQGFSWWPPWRILASGWRLMSRLILGHNTNNGSAGGAAAAAAAATAPFSFNIFEAAAPAGDSSSAAGARFSLGQASALSGSASSSHARHGAGRSRTTHARNHNRVGDSSDQDYVVRHSEHDWHNDTQQRQEQAARWTFPPVSSAAAAAAAARGSGGLSEAFSAARQEQQRPQRRQEQDEPAAPLAELNSRPSPSGKRQRSEETDSRSRPWSVNDATPVARGAYAATLDVSGQAGASSSGGQASQAAAGASSSNTSSPVPAALGNMPAAMADRLVHLAVAMTTSPEAATSAAFALSAQAAQAQAAALAPTAAFAPPPSQQQQVQAQEDSDSVSSGESLPDLRAHADGAADEAASSDEQQHEATQPHPSAQASVGEATGNVPLAQHQGVVGSSSTNQQGADAQQAWQGPLTAAGAAAVARLGNAAALAAGSPEAAAAAAPGAEQDDSSSLPELLDSRDHDVMDAGQDSGSDSMPSLGTGSESGSEDESDGANTGPPSLGAGSSDDPSLTVSSEGDDDVPPLLGNAETADGDHPPALVSGSEDDDSDADPSSEGRGVRGHDPDMPGLTPGFLSDPTARRYSQQQRQQQASAAAGGWDPAGLHPGQHSSGLQSGFLANGVGVGRRDESGPRRQQQQQQQQGSGDSYSMTDSYYNRQRGTTTASASTAAPGDGGGNSGSGQQQQQSATSQFYTMSDSYYNRARGGPAAQPAATAAAASGRTRVVDDDTDSGSEGSWETASDQDLEHAQTTTAAAADTAAADASSGAAAAAGTAAGAAMARVRPRELYEGSAEEEDEDEDEDGSFWDDEDDSYNDSYDEDEDEDEDEEEDEDENEEACGCPLCTSMRLISSPLGMSLFGAAHGHGHSSSGGSARHRGDAQPAPAYSRPRSNAFMVPNSSSSRTAGGLDSLCGDTGGGPSSRRPAGLPSLPPRGRRGSSAGLAAERLPEGCVTHEQSKARVDGVAGLLADAAFTQQLLQGLGGVDPGHSSVQYALEVLRGKKYMPVNTAVQLMAPGGVHKVMSQGEMQQSEAQSAARQLIRQWS